VTLTDADPLIALINRNDPHHEECVATLTHLPSSPLITTWPCFTEAMYLLFRAGGFPAQQDLWRMLDEGRLVLHDLTESEVVRSAELMTTYHDKPMDLADATLVATAEALRTQEIFAIDNDFRIYRLAGGSFLRVIP
jgi:predicted nucleic acid-binding protein